MRSVDDGRSTPARTAGSSTPVTVTPSGTLSGKPPLFRHPKRVAIVGAGLFLVAALIAGAIGSADTTNLLTSQRQPKEVESFSPQQNARVPPSTPITVDLRDDLTADISICGPNPENCTQIPFDQLRFVSGLGQITFTPGDTTDLSAYPAGVVTVHVEYRPQGTQTAIGSFTWSFVAAA